MRLPQHNIRAETSCAEQRRPCPNVHTSGLTTCRNKDVILHTVKGIVSEVGFEAPQVLEIASGTGQHVAHLAKNMPTATFLPTEFSKTLHR